jgi:hypothetical protein
VSSLTGIDPIAAAEFAQEKKEGRQSNRPDFVNLYEERTKSLRNLKQTLRDIFGGDDPKVFVFVDELDRCRPDFAISYLETIKHIFDIHGLVFILAVDSSQLASSAKVLFGEKLNIEEYFRKFLHRQFSLPEADEGATLQLARSYVVNYFEREGKRLSIFPVDDEHSIARIVEFMTTLKLTLRQSQEVFRILGHVFVGNEENRGNVYWAYGSGVILMASLKVGNTQMFNGLGTSQINHLDVGKYLKSKLTDRSAAWWFSVYITGTEKSKEHAYIESLFQDLGWSNDGQFISDNLEDFRRGWGRSGFIKNRFTKIFGNIESIASF